MHKGIARHLIRYAARPLLISIYILSLSTTVFAGKIGKYTFPDNPNPDMTPGVFCTQPDSYRYPEHIPYCDRKVSSSTKKKVIQAYDSQLDYNVGKLPRDDFKIDHFIPLSLGGDNGMGNLWPQHKSIYKYSDNIEQYLSILMQRGRIKHVEAVEAIKSCKLHLERCEQIEADLKKRL